MSVISACVSRDAPGARWTAPRSSEPPPFCDRSRGGQYASRRRVRIRPGYRVRPTFGPTRISIRTDTSSLNPPRWHPEDLDGIRRSLAIGGSLTCADTERLLDACAALLAGAGRHRSASSASSGRRSLRPAPPSTSRTHRRRRMIPSTAPVSLALLDEVGAPAPPVGNGAPVPGANGRQTGPSRFNT